MAIITITSDMNPGDYYLAAVKGTLISQIPNCSIFDLAHSGRPFDNLSSAFNLKNGYSFFPEGSIHILSVNEMESPDVSHVVIASKGHYFIGPDNGIFSMVLGDDVVEVYALNPIKELNTETFPLLQKFAPAAVHIAKGLPLSSIGYKRERLNLAYRIEPAFEENVIRGSIIYIDHYSNAITNISESLFEKVGKGRKFTIMIKSNAPVRDINKRYNQAATGYPAALFNHLGLLEIATNSGAAAKLFGLQVNQTIRIEFS
jgi:S-adenosylmethionine hydrolase